jgi:cytochrome P450
MSGLGSTRTIDTSVASPSAAQAILPPQTRLSDLGRLAVRLVAGVVRHPTRLGFGETLGAWLHDLTRRYNHEAVLVRVGPKKFLIVGGTSVSRAILEPTPASDRYVAGNMKVGAVSYLAERSLTLAHGPRWESLRAFNEQVLSAGSSLVHQQTYLPAITEAFGPQVNSVADLRAAMSRAMLRIVFDHAPARVADDIQTLFGRVASPLKRRLAFGRGARDRERFFGDLRAAWASPQVGGEATLIAAARKLRGDLSDEDVLQQIPHWMFTFTGSGTDLLVRALALVSAREDVRKRAHQELFNAGAANDASSIGKLEYLDACFREAGRLYPPVTKTFHRAPAGAIAGRYQVPADAEIVHYLPMLYRHASAQPDVHSFKPERWLAAGADARPYPDMFLSGARSCPGQQLIMFVCKTAASLLLQRGLVVETQSLKQEPLPLSFPQKEARFRYDTRNH